MISLELGSLTSPGGFRRAIMSCRGVKYTHNAFRLNQLVDLGRKLRDLFNDRCGPMLDDKSEKLDP